ncbi:hypothetical protein O9992_26770 [Vibrio lentus]|nr:hypothetical protein [Vibrio lentus]
MIISFLLFWSSSANIKYQEPTLADETQKVTRVGDNLILERCRVSASIVGALCIPIWLTRKQLTVCLTDNRPLFNHFVCWVQTTPCYVVTLDKTYDGNLIKPYLPFSRRSTHQSPLRLRQHPPTYYIEESGFINHLLHKALLQFFYRYLPSN